MFLDFGREIKGSGFLFGSCSCLAMAFWILNGFMSSSMCFDFFFFFFFWSTVFQCYLDWPWYGWFCFQRTKCCGFWREVEDGAMWLWWWPWPCAYFSCMWLHVGRRLCSCLAMAFWILDSLWCLLLLAWLLCAVNNPLSSGLDMMCRTWRCFNLRRT